MLTTTKRKIRIPTDEEDARINAGILLDPDNPELTEEDFARMRPAREVLPPEVFAAWTDKNQPVTFMHVTDAEDAARQAALRGRPKLEHPKKRIAIRIDADVLEAFRQSGAGWQTRINALLREAVRSGKV